jgi:hypothetical protein
MGQQPAPYPPQTQQQQQFPPMPPPGGYYYQPPQQPYQQPAQKQQEPNKGLGSYANALIAAAFIAGLGIGVYFDR